MVLGHCGKQSGSPQGSHEAERMPMLGNFFFSSFIYPGSPVEGITSTQLGSSPSVISHRNTQKVALLISWGLLSTASLTEKIKKQGCKNHARFTIWIPESATHYGGHQEVKGLRALVEEKAQVCQVELYYPLI